jgi:hypothetical protein
MAIIPVSGREVGEEIPKKNRLESTVFMIAEKCARRRDNVFYEASIDEKTIIALHDVVSIEETCKQPHIGVFL